MVVVMLWFFSFSFLPGWVVVAMVVPVACIGGGCGGCGYYNGGYSKWSDGRGGGGGGCYSFFV